MGQYLLVFCVFFSICCWTFTDEYDSSTNLTQDTVYSFASELANTTSSLSTLFKPTSARLITSLTAASTPTKMVCDPSKATGCPKDWFRADEETCMIIFSFDTYMYSEYYEEELCKRYGAQTIRESNITSDIVSCLKEAISRTSSYAILLQDGKIFDVQTNKISNITRHMLVNIVCTANKSTLVETYIKSFKLHIIDLKHGTNRTEDLLNSNDTVLTIEESEDILNFTCEMRGFPLSYTYISSLKRELYSVYINMNYAYGVFLNANCEHSDLYLCRDRHYLTSAVAYKRIQVLHSTEFKSFSTGMKTGYLSNTPVVVGESVTMSCIVNSCPPPQMMAITDHARLEIVRVQNISQIEYKLKNVQCSDTGSYLCLAKNINGDILERQGDLTINSRCPAQLCRDEIETIIIYAGIGQTVNVSVCVVSFETIAFMSQRKNSILSVTFTKMGSSNITRMAHISITCTQEEHFGTYNFRFRNIYSPPVNYSLTLIPKVPFQKKTTLDPVQPRSPETLVTKGVAQDQTRSYHQDSTSREKMDFLMITLPIVSINIIFVAIFAVIIYLNRDRLLLKPRTWSKPHYQDISQDYDQSNTSFLTMGNSSEKLMPADRVTDTYI